MVEIIDGRKIASKIKDEIAAQIYNFKGLRPSLAIILVGSREDSELYVSLKEKEGVRVGVDTHLYKLPESTSEQELLEVVDFLNNDASVDGILIQLPLPENLDTDKIISALDPKKDVDGFHPEHPDYVLSPVLSAINACLDETKLNFTNKTACVFYNSEVFGLAAQTILAKKGLTVLPLDQADKADVLVSALGSPKVVTKETIKDKVILIDIGTTKVDGHVIGDIDFEDVKEKASFITPVPGGIGPLTIAFLFKNVLEIYKRKKGIKE